MAKVALLIGVSEYEPGLNPLPAAVKDIEALRRVLQDPEMGGFDQVKTLANPDRQAMESEIEMLFDGRAKDDLVLLFFSGHGIKDDASTLYFASRNTRKNAKGDLIRSTAVETRFVHNIMNNSRAKRQAIILDCCFSGAFDPAFQSKDDGSVDLQTQLGAEGRVVLTSSSSMEYSFEQQGSDLSIYTRYLVEGIETGAGDTNSDGFVSMLELHEYAASKVQETAPKMTPKIIVLKDKGFEIVLAKARVTDPKLKYRKMATRYANAGTIRPAGRAVLNTLRQQLGLTLEEATEIEAEVLRPYQERLANLQQYRETLIAEAEHEYPLGEFAREDLNTLQQMLGLRDEDILPIQQEVEAQFTQQSAAYQQNLVQYEQALTDAIQQEFPFNQQTRQGFERLQQSLGLRGEDITRVEQLLIQQAELRYQEELRQAAEQQRQEQEKAEYKNKLLDPNHANAHYNLGTALYDQGKIEEAIAAYRQAIQLDPNRATTHYYLGVALDYQGKIEEAIAAYRQAIQLDPKNATFQNNLEVALKEQGKGRKFLGENLEQREAQGEDVDQEILEFLAGDQDQEVDQELAEFLKLEADQLRVEGKLDEAINTYREVIELVTGSEYTYLQVDAYLCIADILRKQGKLGKAVYEYKSVLRLDTNNAVAYNSLGDVLKAQGKTKEANEAYQKSEQLGFKRRKFFGIF
jgi:tetratricopeptide (TPR) repeat protein